MSVVSLAEARETRKSQESPFTGGKGYALLHRKIMELPFYRTDSEAVHLWVHIILSANHAPVVVPTEFGETLPRRGEFITGRNKLELETGVTDSRIKYLLNKFEKMGMITRISNKKFTRIFVVKYDDYQPNFVPTACQQSATDNELNNNSLDKSNECASVAENQKSKKPSLSCQDVVDTYHEILPEAPSIRLLSEKRKNLIRTFWKKAGVITRKLDNKPFTLEAWREYLGYISLNRRWMLESRPNQKTGTTWRKRDFEFYLNDNTYLKVREGGNDDNDR